MADLASLLVLAGVTLYFSFFLVSFLDELRGNIDFVSCFSVHFKLIENLALLIPENMKKKYS